MRKFLSLLLALVMVLCCIPAVAETADGVYEGSGAGLNGQIKVSVTVSGGKITEVKVLEHSETAGISDPAIEKIPAAIVEAQSADVDIVSGATFTSKGIIEAVKNALNPDEAKEATMPFEQPDILVIGAGMAGLATAARAAELGLNVLVVDQAATYGGSANVAGGTLLGTCTRMQKEAGIEDDPDLCFADFVRLGGAGNFNEEIAREFAEISGEAVDWLDDLGTDFGDRVPYFGVYQPLNVARNYSGKGGARAFVVSLYAELEKYFSTNAYMMLNTYVTGLVTNDEGAVIGAKARLADGTVIDRCTASVYRYYQQGNYMGTPPTLQDFREELLKQNEPEAQEIALAIELFTDGSLNTFAKHTNVDTHSRLICYDILDLGKQLQPIGMLVVLDSILNRITQNRAKGRNTFIFIDEIYLLFQHEYSANFLFTLWKRVRKYGAYCTGITQNVDDLLQSHTARTMLANSEFIIMLNQASTDRLELAKILNLSDLQMSYITNVGAGQGLLKVGSSLVPFVNKFPRNTELYKLMTTKFGEV